MRCIIGFFGLTRSLRHTAGSIRAAFYEPLQQAGIKRLTAGHFNLPDEITNPRSGEFALPVDRAETALLDLDLCWVEPQLQDNIAAPLTVASMFEDRFGDGYKSLANLCHQLHSLSRLWSLLQLFEPAEDDCFLLLRPDLFYLDKLDPPLDLAPLLDREADLVVPDWQGWGGLNDRFAFCSRRGAEIYTARLYSLLDACVATGGLHSETMLAMVAREKALRVAHTAMRAVRVRANGCIADNDRQMMAAKRPFGSSFAAEKQQEAPGFSNTKFAAASL